MDHDLLDRRGVRRRPSAVRVPQRKLILLARQQSYGLHDVLEPLHREVHPVSLQVVRRSMVRSPSEK